MVRPLLVVELLLRSKGEFADLPHVVNAVSLFLDSSVELPLYKACELGSIKLLRRIWASSEVYVKNNPDASWSIRKFIRRDKFYRQHQFTLSMLQIVEQKDMTMARWLADKLQGCTVTMDVVLAATRAGFLEILQFFREQDNKLLEISLQEKFGLQIEWPLAIFSVAAAGGHGNVLWWAWNNVGAEVDQKGIALEEAVQRGDIPMAQWLLDRGCRWPQRAQQHRPAHEVARTGRLDVLKWLHTYGQLEGAAGLVVKAAREGHFDMVCWLIERDVQRGGNMVNLGGEASLAIHAAAGRGHLDVAKYLRARAKRATNSMQRALEAAEQQRQLQLLSTQIDGYLQTEAVSANTMKEAAQYGFLSVVKWLITEYSDDPGVALFDDGKENENRLCAMDAAASSGRLHVVKYLHQLQRSIDASNKKRKRDDVAMSSGPHCTKAAMDGAAAHGYLSVVTWLHYNRSEGCSTKAMDSAAREGHLDVVKFLQTQVGRMYNSCNGWRS